MLRKLPKLANVEDWMAGGMAIDMSLADWLRQNGASDEAIRLMDSNLNGRTLAELSTLHMQRTSVTAAAGAQLKRCGATNRQNIAKIDCVLSF